MGWKIYFCVFSIMVVYCYISLFPSKSNAIDFIDAIMYITTLIGIYGYAFKKKILYLTFWRSFFFGIIIWDIFNDTLFNAHNDLDFTIELLIIILSLLITLPGYIAIYLYGFKSDIFKKIPCT